MVNYREIIRLKSLEYSNARVASSCVNIMLKMSNEYAELEPQKRNKRAIVIL